MKWSRAAKNIPNSFQQLLNITFPPSPTVFYTMNISSEVLSLNYKFSFFCSPLSSFSGNFPELPCSSEPIYCIINHIVNHVVNPTQQWSLQVSLLSWTCWTSWVGSSLSGSLVTVQENTILRFLWSNWTVLYLHRFVEARLECIVLFSSVTVLSELSWFTGWAHGRWLRSSIRSVEGARLGCG